MRNKILCALIIFISILLSPAELNATTVPLGQVQYPTAVVAASSSTSGALSTNGMSLVGCIMPATLTSTAISFTVSATLSGTYVELDNSSGKVSYTVAEGKYIAINPTDFYGVQFFKIITGSTEGSSRNLVCSLKGI